jgi:hypothetical protein
MAAAAGATGVRSWLQTRHTTWLTRRRLKVATIAITVVAFAVSTIGLSGSTATRSDRQHPAAVHQPR